MLSETECEIINRLDDLNASTSRVDDNIPLHKVTIPHTIQYCSFI